MGYGGISHGGQAEVPELCDRCTNTTCRWFLRAEATPDSGEEGSASGTPDPRSVHAFSDDLCQLPQAPRVLLCRDPAAEVGDGNAGGPVCLPPLLRLDQIYIYLSETLFPPET